MPAKAMTITPCHDKEGNCFIFEWKGYKQKASLWWTKNGSLIFREYGSHKVRVLRGGIIAHHNDEATYHHGRWDWYNVDKDGRSTVMNHYPKLSPKHRLHGMTLDRMLTPKETKAVLKTDWKFAMDIMRTSINETKDDDEHYEEMLDYVPNVKYWERPGWRNPMGIC